MSALVVTAKTPAPPLLDVRCIGPREDETFRAKAKELWVHREQAVYSGVSLSNSRRVRSASAARAPSTAPFRPRPSVWRPMGRAFRFQASSPSYPGSSSTEQDRQQGEDEREARKTGSTMRTTLDQSTSGRSFRRQRETDPRGRGTSLPRIDIDGSPAPRRSERLRLLAPARDPGERRASEARCAVAVCPIDSRSSIRRTGPACCGWPASPPSCTGRLHRERPHQRSRSACDPTRRPGPLAARKGPGRSRLFPDPIPGPGHGSSVYRLGNGINGLERRKCDWGCDSGYDAPCDPSRSVLLQAGAALCRHLPA